MCTVKKSENQYFHYILETKRDIAKKFADLISLRSDNVMVEFWRKSEIVIFSRNERVVCSASLFNKVVQVDYALLRCRIW